MIISTYPSLRMVLKLKNTTMDKEAPYAPIIPMPKAQDNGKELALVIASVLDAVIIGQ